MSAQVFSFPPRTARAMPIDMAARVAVNIADLKEWQRSPSGRLIAALNTLRAIGWDYTADRVYAIHCRFPDMPSTAVGEALTELLSIPLDDAMPRLAVADGCRALADMLTEPQTQGAA